MKENYTTQICTEVITVFETVLHQNYSLCEIHSIN